MPKLPRQIAVLGAGVMGSRIACHLLHTGAEVTLFDLSTQQSSDRSQVARQSFERAIQEKPLPLYAGFFSRSIRFANFDDHMHQLSKSDWIIEAVVEVLEIKQKIFADIEIYRRPGTLVTSNTSGIPLRLLSEGRGEDFQRHFCGTHFFNPPRYLPLLELIPGPGTDPEVLSFFKDYGARFLGKEVLLCKDTPAFVANRIGLFSLLSTLSAMKQSGLSVSEVDLLTGPLIGRPKSATFRTLDLVGLDVFMKVVENLYPSLPEDEKREQLRPPELLFKLHEAGHWGEKRGQGFYKKVKTEGGTEIHEIDPQTGQYALRERRNFPELRPIRAKNRLEERLSALIQLPAPLGNFYRHLFYALFSYSSYRLPEIADDVNTIDTALRAGFGWALGPFQTWEAMGIAKTSESMKAAGHKVASWVEQSAQIGSFYSHQDEGLEVYSPKKKQFLPSSTDQLIRLHTRRPLWENASAQLFDLGDGILCLASRSKMNILNVEFIEALYIAIDRTERDSQGLVIGQETPQFSAGADLGLLLSHALEGDYEEIDRMVQQFQRAMLRIRYANVAVVVATRGLTLGGGCELAMHSDQIEAQAETYIGLVEMGAGLIPAGGGTKEIAARLSADLSPQDVVMNRLQSRFQSIATAEVSTSAHQGLQLGYLRSRDRISMSAARLLTEAKQAALCLAQPAYRPPMSSPIHVQGQAGIALLEVGITQMSYAGHATSHDVIIAKKIAHVINGGDLSVPGVVSEAYLLDLEREAFLSLCGEPKTMDRMQHILRKGKPLRN